MLYLLGNFKYCPDLQIPNLKKGCFGNVLHLWLSTSSTILRFLGFFALRSAEAWSTNSFWLRSYLFSPLSLLHPEDVEVRWVPFRGLRGLMHWDTNVLKRPRRWQWTTITPRPERKQVWTWFSLIFFKTCYITMITELKWESATANVRIHLVANITFIIAFELPSLSFTSWLLLLLPVGFSV